MKNVELTVFLEYENEINFEEVEFLKHQIKSMLEFQVKSAAHYQVEACEVVEIN